MTEWFRLAIWAAAWMSVGSALTIMHYGDHKAVRYFASTGWVLMFVPFLIR